MRKSILIRNARSFDAALGLFSPACGIRIQDGVVAELAQNIPVTPDMEVPEGGSLYWK